MFLGVLALLLSFHLQPIQSNTFEQYGTRGKHLAEIGGLSKLEQAASFFHKQKSKASSKREAFTAFNNVAVTMLRIGNLKHPATNSIAAYRTALQSWRKCLKLNRKSKKIRKNLLLLAAACRRRFHGAPSCDEALKKDSPYQQSPKFLRSLFKGNVVINARTGSSSNTNGEASQRDLLLQMSSQITEGMKNVRLYKKIILSRTTANGSDDNDKYGEFNTAQKSDINLPHELGTALFQFTEASGLYSMAQKTTGPTATENNNNVAVADAVVVVNNIAAVYLIMADAAMDSVDMNRDVVRNAQQFIHEAQRILFTHPLVKETFSTPSIDLTDLVGWIFILKILFYIIEKC